MIGRWDLVALPGPRHHLDTISTDLHEGRSCVWLVPDELVKTGLADECIDELVNRHDGLHIPAPKVTHEPVSSASVRPAQLPGSSGDLPSWARDAFGDHAGFGVPAAPVTVSAKPQTMPVADRIAGLLGLPIDEHPDSVSAIASSWQARGKILVICGWQEPDGDALATMLTRLTALVKAQGQQPTHRPRLLLAVREGDLPVAALDRLDPMTSRVRWWWGVIGRLDTSVVVATTRPRIGLSVSGSQSNALRELIAAEVITEVAGPDLLLAEQLAMSWDGRISTLGKLLAESVRDVEDDFPSGFGTPRLSGTRPPHELRPAWRLGVADLWEHQARLSPIAKCRNQTGLDALIWRGQNRVLMPLADEYRARLEQVFRSRASRTVLADLAQQNRQRRTPAQQPRRTVLELGAMAWAVSAKKIRLPRADNELLFSLLDVRNALAHLQPIADEAIDRLTSALPQDHS
ncbi:hypothetical protein ACH347_22435 [Saccharopolyspora sp. 5N102]|uniref:hypothetical protein n=1 Tax=Saccharopolyspora sp. 5N102 TaxID=3375155 RepID=UPI003798ECAE